MTLTHPTSPALTDVPPADAPAPAVAPAMAPLRIGPYELGTPVVLAPMAGITNRAFRRLCREAGPECLFVSEMITSRALVERSPETMRLIEHDPEESPRSIQLYGVDPRTVGLAARLLVTEDRADHIDLNFGCPVPKVTRKGGGSALPWKTELFRGIVRSAVTEASRKGVPVTVKMRVGIDADHITYLDAARIAEAEGVAAVALHARTAAQAYSGQADWSAIARLKEAVTSIPVLGNGDIWSAQDALEMVRQTGCDGVVVGRGCLGRPWLFADLAAAFAGSAERATPSLGQVSATLRRHAVYLAEFYEDEAKACRDIQLPAQDPWPGDPAEGQRGRAGSPRHVVLPERWLDSRDLDAEQAQAVAQAELSVSGG